jgi:molybdopterin converting factor small subunit
LSFITPDFPNTFFAVPRFDVLLFAIAKDLAKTDSIAVEVSLPVSANELMRAIGEAEPALRPWLSSCRLAVNQSYVSGEESFIDIQEIALIPPVSGG